MPKLRIIPQLLILVVTAGSSAGCKVGPDHTLPYAPIDFLWKHEDAERDPAIPRAACPGPWWNDFDDPALNGLVTFALENNRSLRETEARVITARALRAGTASRLFPSSDLTAEYMYKRVSGNGSPFQLADQDSFSLDSTGFDAVWEIDLWGKYRRSLEAVGADAAAASSDYAYALVTLIGDVAATYVELRMYQQRLIIAERNLRTQAETLSAIEMRNAAGLSPKLDVAQARANLYTTESAIPPLRVAIEKAENRLSVLCGQPPYSLAAELGQPGVIPVATTNIEVGVPADLLRARPDVCGAEREVAAESARIGVAEAELYPQLSITGLVKVDSTDITRLFEPQSLVHDVGPSFRWNILNFGRVRAGIRAQEARYQEAVYRYQSTVLTALEEVENALASVQQEELRQASLTAAVDAARQAVTLSQLHYEQGLVDFQTVLASQSSLLLLEDRVAVSQAALALSRIALHKALGGGWPTASPARPAEAIVADRPDEETLRDAN